MKKNFKKNIESTSVSVRCIMPDGIYVSVLGKDYYLSYDRLPWFKTAEVSDIFNVQIDEFDYAIRWEGIVGCGFGNRKSETSRKISACNEKIPRRSTMNETEKKHLTDLHLFPNHYVGTISKSGLEKITGTNQKQLRHYYAGKKTPGKI